ncbi:CDP-glycerol glycerophosphotransferase family protein [Pedococcus sp. 5OH_020]|uniref:CDP-glycerol glycerophosphotransferase family protein n=1 Tax=Pedococcus sp. 5OH_020 TaxID=2989814 RepID=UPI0022E9CD11|nr:CDP-glycerol glycerophosphotransferase family protein [Pedococcus sp. 5OH_020]
MTALASTVRRVRPMLRSGESWAAVAWFTTAAVAAVSALAGWGWVLAASLAAGYVAEIRLYAAPDQLMALWLGRREMGAVDRALFRQSVGLLGWLVITHPAVDLIVLAVATMGALQAAHAGYRVMSGRHRRRRRGRVFWRGLSVQGRVEGPEVLPATVTAPGAVTGARVVLLLDVFLVAGLVASGLARQPWPLVTGAALSMAGLAWVAARVVARTRLIARLPTPALENAHLRAALEAHRPEVAVYFSGGADTTYQLNVWLVTIDRLHQPALIILRERLHLEALPPTSTPVVVLPRAQDVEAFQLASIRLALFPTTVIKNNHMIRLRGIRHVFINHGDGDKSVTYSPLHRVFDEIWVAGQAACDRYLNRGEGVRPEQLVTVGRPQLAHIDRTLARAGTRRTVLYAPTWEGNFEGVNYSSVAAMGELVIETLLDPALDVRVLFKAHPATGTRLTAAAHARAAIEGRIREAGRDHQVVGPAPDALYAAFNEADVLVADISSVVADFLASRKPYLVTNPSGTPSDRYHADFPSAAGGGLVTADRDVIRAALVDALGPDSHRARREQLATYFLGEPVADPIEHFADEVDRALKRAPKGVLAGALRQDDPDGDDE